MIPALMALALRERVVVLGIAIILLLAGAYSFSQLDIEAYPDPVQPMVEVLTLPNGLSAEEVERIVTVPLEFGLSGMLGLRAMRSISLFGLSDIRCYFDWDSDYIHVAYPFLVKMVVDGSNGPHFSFVLASFARRSTKVLDSGQLERHRLNAVFASM